MIKKGISRPNFYSDIIIKDNTFTSDTSKVVNSLKNLIRKGYRMT